LVNFSFFPFGACLLSHIHIVLVETSHPGNIGAVARAMKNMAMSNLRLVKPKIFPSADATARASGADDVLSHAIVYDDLAAAIADCQIVIGTSARGRTLSWPELTPRQCAEQFVHSQGQQIAIVFGRENSGLKNQELDLCQYLLHIPCNSGYSSLNIAAAVQIICYELFVASGDQPHTNQVGDKGEMPLANSAQMESFYTHLLQTLYDINFMQGNNPDSIMRRLRRIYNRTQLDTKELDILRGILKMSQGNRAK
jgi:tRNA (cytidine32/uridine32-2'-O)-methyltransferase